LTSEQGFGLTPDLPIIIMHVSTVIIFPCSYEFFYVLFCS